jgi:hypothetical protein
MREQVIKVIRSTKDVTNAVILTHNIDFVFVQSVVIPALRKCGSPTLTVFADANCAADTYQYQARVLASLGLRYRVVPVAMESGFRFHPKAVLLSGPQAATLLVGSGNLTFGGWGENGEVWCQYDSKADEIGVFGDFYSYMREVVALCAEPREAITAEVDEAFDPNTRAWAGEMSSAQRLLGRAGHGASMLERMKSVAAGRGSERLYVCAPYFDQNAEALQAMSRELGAESTTVLVQSQRTNLPAAAAANLGRNFDLREATFEHMEKVGAGGDERTREVLLHAKFYGVQQDDQVTVFTGSANCSQAALTIPGSAGNAELMTHVTMPVKEFQRRFLDELVVTGQDPELSSTETEPTPVFDSQGYIRVHAARMEFRHIRVAFQSDSDTTVIGALLDDDLVEPIEKGDGWATFRTSLQPRVLLLVGKHLDTELRSLPHWIDNEDALRASARGRSLANSINTRVRSESWGIGAWSDVLSELYKHLQYMPQSSPYRHASDRNNGGDETGPVQFEWGDVFTSGYGFPEASGFAARVSADLEGSVGGLRAMLLRWYGIVEPETDDGDDVEDDNTVQPDATSPAEDDGDVTDRVKSLQRATPRPRLSPPTEKERRRALRLIKQVTSRIAEPEFLSERGPEVLASDLKVAAILLRAGLADEWLTEQDFFDATLAIWLPLFFNAAGNESTGWLEQRYLTAPDPEEFAIAIRSVELAAALGCWALSTPTKPTSPEHARFDLASALGVARLPWLWQTGGNEKIAEEIAELFAHTCRNDELDWKAIQKGWLTLIRRGYALQCLDQVIRSVDIKDLRSRVKQTNVTAGELLWQSSYGFCISRQDCERSDKQSSEVLVLQQGNATKKFSPPFLMPVAGLLEEGVLSDEAMPPKARVQLAAMVEELRVSLRVIA